ncbi:MAG: YHS domain-containing protein [Candidatus Aminicenantaceae bacterium]
MSKKSRMLTLFMMMSLVLVLAGISQLQAAEKVTCAVNGKEFEKTDDTASFEYKGETYYFCCPGCKDKFVKNPDEFLNTEGEGEHQHAEEAEHQHGEEGMHGEHQENGKVVDPVCGMELKKEDAKHTYEYKEKTYYFCMASCKEKFVENPEEYLKDADEQMTCPVSGETFAKSEAAGSMEYEGKTYYLCCAGCLDKFKADPAKYIK